MGQELYKTKTHTHLQALQAGQALNLGEPTVVEVQVCQAF